GKLLAYQYRDPQTAQHRVAVITFEGGQSVSSFDIPFVDGPLRWTSDSQALAYILGHSTVTNCIIKLQPLSGGPPQTLLQLSGGLIFSFDLSRDGKQLAYASGSSTTSLILLSEVK